MGKYEFIITDLLILTLKVQSCHISEIMIKPFY